MTLLYRSTRSGDRLGSFTDILLEGLAPDGGLAVPERTPGLPADLEQLSKMPYPALAAAVVGSYATDIAQTDLLALTQRAYTAERFGTNQIAPLTQLGMVGGTPMSLLELSNGPTLAFKDMAMQLLGQLFEFVLAKRSQSLNILGATSGDTGSAAEHAMRGKRGISVFMLSPSGRMSAFQRAQMFSLQDPNIHNFSVPGSFDDCQDMVKAVSEDLTFKSRHRIGSVNSINWARVSAQIVYYFTGYFQAIAAHGGRLGDPVSFCVPSGNFGNVLAGHMARKMGLPISRLVVATNENDVLHDFFQTGTYRPRHSNQTHQTSSPSMDISKASNFERYVFDLVDQDSTRLAALWQRLAEEGAFTLKTPAIRAAIEASGLVSGRSHHAARLETIASVYRDHGRVIDPHTADGVFVSRQHLEPGVPMVCLETALPAKFGEIIEEALGMAAPRPRGFEAIESLPQRVEALGRDVDGLKRRISEMTGLSP
jgi:threonine synthase